MKRYYLITITLAICLYVLVVLKPSYNAVSSQLRNLLDSNGDFRNDLEIKPRESGVGTISMEEYIKGPLPQNDVRIVKYIKDNGFIQPPCSKNKPYKLRKPERDPSMGQSQIAKKIFQGKTNGFFIECGALDGETRSNTLSLEKDLGWKGLLIEADPKNFKLLLKKNRRAWAASCCLAVHPFPHEVIFTPNFNTGKIKSELRGVGKPALKTSGTRVQCLPLFSLLSAIGVKTVDFFSLDVEGFEMGVLESIPFDLLTIKVLTVEFTHGKGGPKALIEFMEGKNYRVVTKLTHNHSLANDVIFAHNSFPIQEEFADVIQSEKLELNPEVKLDGDSD
ncbi:unnamed protein product [Allacma fusca]|uniref:Methyltransferase FkbM domain-containing protein n=1 Tax=Allacma fusca TaxID=39272 RepID=A0A8J2KKH1_9HEXA|nr:unnamed protein product [Allacma fusca]